MKSYIYSILLLTLLGFWGCSDFLDRDPKTSLSPANFWKTESDLQMALNVCYSKMNRAYSKDNQTTDCFANVGNTVSSGTYAAPNTDEEWKKAYAQIRICNDFLINYKKAQVSDAVKNRYAGEARFFRAYFYFNLITRFGDVPYITEPLDIDSPELFGERDSKAMILDRIIADLDSAETYIPLKSKMKTEVGRITKGTAQAFLARAAQYYGTYYKFRGEGDHKKYLQIARNAAKRLIDSREYSLYKDYQNLFLLPGEDSDEHILSYRYSMDAKTYNVRIRNVFVDFDHEPTKYIADAFLCKDGLPAGKSAYAVEYLPLGTEFKNRDPRMALTIWKPGDECLGAPLVPNLSNQTKTGYIFKKYGDEKAYTQMESEIDEILIRYAEVLLIYAESSYELNDQISDADLNISVNELRRRFAGDPDQLPDLTNDFVNRHTLNMREEIRRERRVELAGEAMRYDDLIRWKTAETELPRAILGAKFDPQAYPKIKPGKDVILDENGFILVQKASSRAFDPEKDYLFPLPLRECALNDKLIQNPHWN